MQKRNGNENPMFCTVPALAPKFKLPIVTFPSLLKSALRSIYFDQRKSISGSNRCSNYIKCIESLSNIQTINQQDYLMILKICLYLLQFEEDLEMKRYKLTNHIVKQSDFNCFIINIGSLNSDHAIGPDCCVTLSDCCQSPTKKRIFAKVVKVLRDDVTIVCKSRDAKILKDENKEFDINFLSQHWPLRCCHYALKIISNCNWIEILYPQSKTDCTDMEIDIEWINTDMKKNERQKQAVRKILNTTARPAPYIIFGPPGTGKTATLVEAICQIMRQFPTKHILVCTVSNAAAEEITKRLIKHIPTNLIYRMYAPSREWAFVDEEIRPCANFVEKTTLFLSKELLLLKRIVITTLVSSIRLIELNLSEEHFSYIIIDEASQAIEPDMLIPLAITNQKSENKRTGFQAQIVIAGDPYQLGPVLRCKRIEHLLERSMLERLMNDCEPYRKQDGKYNPNYITKLVKNYRSHKSLLYVSNSLFYNDELEPCGGPDTQMALNWPQLPNKKFPMIFQEVLGTEERTITQSVFNTGEVLAVLMYVDMLIKTKFGKRAITPKDIGIITPFKQQQLDISHYLAAMKLENITVGTVESFQGQERNVMILSTVRTKIFKHNDKEHIGFLSNPKRFNVALTRAKALTIIIGNPNILSTDKHWKVLWNYCKEHNAYIPFKQLPLKENIIAKLKGDSKVKSSEGRNAMKLSVTVELGKEERETKKLFDVLVCKLENLKLKQE